MFPVWIHNGTTPPPRDAVFYEVAANGIFLHKAMPYWKAVVPVEKIPSIAGGKPALSRLERGLLQEGKSSLELLLPPIPGETVKTIVRFFAWVYGEHRTEALVLVWWNEGNRSYVLSAPPQEIAPGGVHYRIPPREKPGCLIGTFHSHGALGAFHSSVDVCDERFFDGIHGTLGSFSAWAGGKRSFSLSLQAAINDTRFALEPTEWMEGLMKTSDSRPMSNPYGVAVGGLDMDTRYYGGMYYPICLAPRFAFASGEEVLPDTYAPPREWVENLTVEKWYGIAGTSIFRSGGGS